MTPGMNLTGIRFGADIAAAAAAHHLDPALLAAVAAQETGGPGSDSGRNVVGDGGHGHGLFQIDDRSWAFARSPAAMNPAKNADVAATLLADNLRRYGGNVQRALTAYNAGAPDVPGTKTTWGDGATLAYAASVMRHYASIVAYERPGVLADRADTTARIDAPASLGALHPGAPPLAQAIPAVPSGPTVPGGPNVRASTATPGVAPRPALSPAAAGVPTGSQASAAQATGAQADYELAALLDRDDIFGQPDGDDA